MRSTPWIALAALTWAATNVSAQLRVVSYNMLDKPASLADSTVVNNVSTVYSAIAARNVNGIAKRPDIIFLSEQTAASPANLATILNNTFGVSSYVSVTPTSPQNQGSSDRIAYVYDTATVSLSSTPVSLPISSSYPRPTIRAGFRPVGYSGAESDVYVYGMHLKASTGDANVLQRANQTLATRANADTLPAGSNIIYAGDFNVYTSAEQGYRNFFAAGNGQAADPINASYLANGNPIAWNNNGAYAAVHTQSTRLVTLADGGATGGVDDRFDFQLVSNALLDGNGISYIGPTSPDSGSVHSYTALGNNGSTFNRAINDANNTAAAPAVLNALYAVSDHLPIVADYQLPAKMSVTAGTIPAEVIQGANVALNVSVLNSASVSAPLAADALDYSISATNTTGGPLAGSVRATLPADQRSLAVDTATPGHRTVQLNVTSSSQAVADGTFTTSQPITIYSPAQPSLNAAAEQSSGTVDFGIVALGSSASGAFDVYNVPVGGFTAGLDLDAASSSGDAAFSTQFTPQQNIDAGDSRAVGFTFTPALSGLAQATLSVLTSDVDLPGASSRQTLTIDLVARGAYAGDANLSDTVDFDDLLIIAQHYAQGDATWTVGDFNRDQFVGFDDLLALSQNYGLGTGSLDASTFAADWALARSLVPEPGSLATLVFFNAMARRGYRRSLTPRRPDAKNP